MAHKSKYLALYNGIPMPFDDIRVFAKNVMGFRIERNELSGGWKVYLNGKPDTMGYTDEWTEQEVEDDYLKESNFIARNTYSNLTFYKLLKYDRE